jgi:hypothetical protein
MTVVHGDEAMVDLLLLVQQAARLQDVPGEGDGQGIGLRHLRVQAPHADLLPGAAAAGQRRQAGVPHLPQLGPQAVMLPAQMRAPRP